MLLLLLVVVVVGGCGCMNSRFCVDNDGKLHKDTQAKSLGEVWYVVVVMMMVMVVVVKYIFFCLRSWFCVYNKTK